MASNAIDMKLENTVFLIAPVQFSVVRIVILFIQFSNAAQNASYFVMYKFVSTDFAGFREVTLIARSCAIFGRFREITKLRNSKRACFSGLLQISRVRLYHSLLQIGCHSFNSTQLNEWQPGVKLH